MIEFNGGHINEYMCDLSVVGTKKRMHNVQEYQNWSTEYVDKQEGAVKDEDQDLEHEMCIRNLPKAVSCY